MAWTYKFQRKYAISLGIAIARDMFIMFSDPKNQGQNFAWERFPEIVERHARIGSPISWPFMPNEEMVDLVRHTAKIMSIDLLTIKNKLNIQEK